MSGRQWVHASTWCRNASTACSRVTERHRPLFAAAQQSPMCADSTFAAVQAVLHQPLGRFSRTTSGVSQLAQQVRNFCRAWPTWGLSGVTKSHDPDIRSRVIPHAEGFSAAEFAPREWS